LVCKQPSIGKSVNQQISKSLESEVQWTRRVPGSTSMHHRHLSDRRCRGYNRSQPQPLLWRQHMWKPN